MKTALTFFAPLFAVPFIISLGSFDSSAAGADLAFTACRYSFKPASDEAIHLSTQVVMEVKRHDFNQALKYKKLLQIALAGAGRSQDWDFRLLTGEIDALSLYLKLPESERQECISDIGYSTSLVEVLLREDSTNALVELERRIKSIVRRLGQNSVIVPRQLNSLAAIQIAFQRYDDAMRTCEQASALAKDAIGELSPELVRASYMRVLILRTQGKNADADILEVAAIADHLRLRSLMRTVSGIDDYYLSLGLERTYELLMARRQFLDAARVSEQEESITQKVLGRSSQEFAKAALASAVAYTSAADLDSAFKKVSAACEAARQSHVKGEYFYPYVLHQGARIALRFRRFPEAEPLLRESTRLFAEGKHEAYELDTMIDRALVLQEIGDLDGAKQLILQVLERIETSSRAHGNLYVQALACHADILASKKDYFQAIVTITTALSTKESQSDVASQKSLAKMLLQRGDIYSASGDTQAATADYRKAADIFTKVFGPGHSETQRATAKVKNAIPAK